VFKSYDREKEWFDNLDRSKRTQVKMGNGNSIQVEGKGVVKLHVGDGKSRTLNSVQF
jgi:hypothetical protein